MSNSDLRPHELAEQPPPPPPPVQPPLPPPAAPSGLRPIPNAAPPPVNQALKRHQRASSDPPNPPIEGELVAIRRRRWWLFGRRRIVWIPVNKPAAGDRKRLPAWIVSLLAHVCLLLILALIPISRLASGPLTLLYGSTDAAGIAEFELSANDLSMEVESGDMAVVPSPSTTAAELLQVELPELSIPASGSNLTGAPLGITQGLTGRIGDRKSALLSRFGGTAQTEQAVESGLKWLAKQQRSNGAWSLIGPYSDGGSSENETAATALALNAFLGAGYTHKSGKYAENVKLGLKFLTRRQNDDGYFPVRGEPSRQVMYAQAIASIAVSEAYGMTGDSELRVPAEKAMAFAAWSQSKLRGWRYEPREDADLSVTGWYVMALITGKMSGLAVDEAVLNSVGDFLDSVASEDGSRYAYNDFEPPSLTMTAEGLLCRIYLGWPKTHPSLLRAIEVDFLPNLPSEDELQFSVYYWYYATQVLHHVGGPAWERWNRAMRRVLPALQQKVGPEAGSWAPHADAFGASGGRLYTTCLNIYCLEVYYRHLSIYDID